MMRILAGLLAVSLGIVALSAVRAHEGGPMTKPFMQRHAVMGSMAAHITAIRRALGAEDAEAAGRHAEAIHWLARIVPDIFPEGSGPEMGKTRALPKIWSDWDGFTAAAKVLADEAATLASLAKSNDMAGLAAQFAIVGKRGCGGCHSSYRAPKN